MAELRDKSGLSSNGGSHDIRVMSLVRACVRMSRDERSHLLDAECRDDPEMRRQVEQILSEDADNTSSHVISHKLGAHLPDHYKLIGLVGSGGMAEVFLAEDTRLHRRVAIKFLNDAFRRDPERMRRFNQEARAASALNQPNILTIHDIGEIDGVQYIVSEFVDGETLGTRIGRGKIPPEETVEIAIQIASALEAAHAAGIVHRDLKPDNVMLRADGTVKVVDFGLAKSSGGGSQDALTVEAVQTSPGMILGTPRYMSPEQTRAMPLDARSDIFSFGIILFEMLTGKTPFGGGNVADVIAGIIGKEPRRVEDYSPETVPELSAIVYRSLQKERGQRFRDVGEMLAELKDVRRTLIGSHGIRDTRRVERTSGRTSRLKWAGVGILPAIVLVVGGWLWYARGPSSIHTGAMRSVPITSWSTVSAEAVSSATFSPDARMIAFASSKSGNSELWVKPVSGGDPVQITKNGFYNQYPVWSPDGQEIAYFSSRGDTRGIWKVTFTGGQEAQLVGGLSRAARPIRWAADKKLFYQDGSPAEVFSLDISSGEQTKLTELGKAGLTARAVTVSPDGTLFAISVKEEGIWRVKTCRFGSGDFAEIASSKDQIDNIAFQPNGRDVYYSGGADGTIQIYTAAPNNAGIQVSSGSADVTLQDVSSDGSKLLNHSITETSDLWSVSLADGKESVVANDVAEEYWPDISPDGRMVAYQSVGQPDRPFRGAIFVKAIAGGRSLMIASEGFCPAWSPDGEWVAFFRRAATNISIMKVRANGADATLISEGPVDTPGYVSVPYLKTGVSQIAWLPDGNSLAYTGRADGLSKIYIAGPAGAEPFVAAQQATEVLTSPVWDPGGNRIAYSYDAGANPKLFRLLLATRDRGMGRTLYESAEPFRLLGWVGDEIVIAQQDGDKNSGPFTARMNLMAIGVSGGQRRAIASLSNAHTSNVHLSRNGEVVAFTARANDVSQLWTINTRGGTPKKVFEEKDPKILFSSLAWTPDSRSVVFGKQTRTSVLSMLTNN